jgi:hypothetical protein
MIRARIDPIERDIFFEAVEGLSPAGRSKALATVARESLVEADAINTRALGYTPPHTTTVDGASSENLDAVRPDGVISFDFAIGLQAEIIKWILATLKARSPVLTERYQKSHFLYADGEEVDSPDGIEAAEWAIVSTVPYARKIERGLSRKAPNGVYDGADGVAAMAKARYSNIARIRFTFMSPIGGGTMLDQWATAHSSKTSPEKQRKQYERDTRNPAIVITFR